MNEMPSAMVIGQLVSRARAELTGGKDVTLLIDGLGHPLPVTSVEFTGPKEPVLVAVAKYGQDEGATYYFPAFNLRAIRVSEPSYT